MKQLMLGNEAIARGLVENGCAVVTSYPGTPASEILSSVAALHRKYGRPMHVQWAINEKVAFEIAYTGAIAGLRTAVGMKQVGLNVASDPFMSAAYMGTRGGFLVISADDPGPHSSQTEQDSRLLAVAAKIPVLDPDSPRQAKEMTSLALTLSEEFRIPVMLRPTTRVCHARQDVSKVETFRGQGRPVFKKEPTRWAATPKFRFRLHLELEEKIAAISAYAPTAPLRLNPEANSVKAVVACGVASAHAKEIFGELGLWDQIPFYQVLQPYPLHREFIDRIRGDHTEILVLEETCGVVEMQIADRSRVKGKLSGAVPSVGELLPERIEAILAEFSGRSAKIEAAPAAPPDRRPTLCAGCPHRASFFAIKKAAPKGIYTSDIGCYTLGLNLGAVDTVLCMGAAISQASGFYHAFKNERKRPDIVATIGDSTFFHAGIPALVDAVVQNVHFVLVILDNRTTAMTGNQPTPGTGGGAVGEPCETVDIGDLVRGCGVKFIQESDPYRLPDFVSKLKEAVAYSRKTGPAVVIARHPCLLDHREKSEPRRAKAEVTEQCDGCGFCVRAFECPAIVAKEKGEPVSIDTHLCSGCGICTMVCPKKGLKIATRKGGVGA